MPKFRTLSILMHLFSINGANIQPPHLLITVAVLKLKVSMLWATFTTLFCSKYFRELTISSSGHVKYAPKFLAHLKKYLMHLCMFYGAESVFSTPCATVLCSFGPLLDYCDPFF